MDGCSGIDQLSPDEEWLVGMLQAGDEADLRKTNGSQIRATVLRDLLLGRLGAGIARQRIPPMGIRIRHAYVDGKLDLADLRRPDFGLPALALEECDLPDEINLEGSRFARLSIKRSRFSYLKIRESEIDGPFDFSGAKPYDARDRTPTAWIDAQGCIINGQITGSGAHLMVPKLRDATEVKPSERRYALWLANAEVRGSVILLNKFVAEGGVCLRSARVTGDIWASGATVSKGEGFALNAQAAKIGDLVALNDGFSADGKVMLLAAQIGARLLLDGATLKGSDETGKITEPHKDRIALFASNVQVGAAVFMGKNFKAEGEVNFSGATIRGGIYCGEASLNNRTADGQARAFVAIGTEVSNEVLFHGAQVKGRMHINGARIGGRLSFYDAMIDNGTTEGKGVALSAVGARLGGPLLFGSATGSRESASRFQGRINFNGVEVGGKLEFRGCSLQNYTKDGSGIALSAKGAHVSGDVEFVDFRAAGETMLCGSTVHRGVSIRRAVFKNEQGYAIYAKDMQVGGDVRFERETVAEGDLGFERIDVTGNLVWDDVKISRKRKDGARSPLDLRHARIGSVLNAKNLSFVSPSAVDLCGMRVGAIEHTLPEGWGSLRSGEDWSINFDGLTYDRIMLDSTTSQQDGLLQTRFGYLLSRIIGPCRNSLAGKYRDWLKLQKKQISADESNFFPQPYRQLARVLRNQGEESAARDIAIAEQWEAPKPGLLPTVARWVFGRGFGFGLRPRNAMVTLIAFLLLGTVGVRMAKHSGMLMESLVVASTGVERLPSGENDPNPPAHLKRVVPRLDGSPDGPAAEVDCTDAANTWTDDLVYAADMLVPFIPLHQEGKCEIVPGSELKSGVWRCLKAAYEVIGWIIFSLALVTFSGVLKRFDRDAA